MGKIFCLMGKSSSGKDTLYAKIRQSTEGMLKTIVPYTTRPIRSGETNGKEYIFVDDRTQEQLERDGKIIELRAYQTIHGIWKYFTVDDGQIDLNSHSYFIIGTLESYEKMVEYFGEKVMVPIYVEVEDGERLRRALDREMQQEHPKYAELCRRFLADSEDFSEEKLEHAGIKQRFYNEDLITTQQEIIDYITQEISWKSR